LVVVVTSLGIRRRREGNDACLAHGKSFGSSTRSFFRPARRWRTGLQLTALCKIKGLNEKVRLARHQGSLCKTVRPFSPNSYGFVGAQFGSD
jgi:hypothetical protein